MLVPRFHLITPITRVGDLVALVDAGVDAVQIRDKTAGDRALLDFARDCVTALRPLGAAVLVNDRVDIALAAGADGVHLGATDLPVRAARALGFRMLIGSTCRTAADVAAAAEAGADYVGFGPVFPSASKDDLPEPLGAPAIRAAAGTLPVVAIGGISASRVRSVLASGAHGVAVIGAVSRAADPPRAARKIAAALQRG